MSTNIIALFSRVFHNHALNGCSANDTGNLWPVRRFVKSRAWYGLPKPESAFETKRRLAFCKSRRTLPPVAVTRSHVLLVTFLLPVLLLSYVVGRQCSLMELLLRQALIMITYSSRPKNLINLAISTYKVIRSDSLQIEPFVDEFPTCTIWTVRWSCCLVSILQLNRFLFLRLLQFHWHSFTDLSRCKCLLCVIKFIYESSVSFQAVHFLISSRQLIIHFNWAFTTWWKLIAVLTSQDGRENRHPS